MVTTTPFISEQLIFEKVLRAVTANYIDRQCLHCTVIQVPLRLHLSGGETRFSLHSHEKLDSSFWPPIWPPAQRPTIWASSSTHSSSKDSRGCFRSRQITACKQAHGRQKRKAAQGLTKCTRPCPVRPIEPFSQAQATIVTIHAFPRSPVGCFSSTTPDPRMHLVLGASLPARMHACGSCDDEVFAWHRCRGQAVSQKHHPLRSIHQRSSNATSSKITSPSALQYTMYLKYPGDSGVWALATWPLVAVTVRFP